MKRHVDYNLAKSIHTVLCYWFMGISRMREVCPQCTGHHGRAGRECFLKEEHSEFIFEQLRELKYIREKNTLGREQEACSYLTTIVGHTVENLLKNLSDRESHLAVKEQIQENFCSYHKETSIWDRSELLCFSLKI